MSRFTKRAARAAPTPALLGACMGGAFSAGTTLHAYLPTASGPMPVLAIVNGVPYAVHSDHLNTPRRLTAASGQVLWQWAYSAFGEEPATTAATCFASVSTVPAAGTTSAPALTYNLRYPGQFHDADSGLFYNYFRTYDPGTGRYVQSDPIGLEGGINTYAYVAGNPISYTDPTGEFIHIGIGFGIGALAGGLGAAQNPCATWQDIALGALGGGLAGGITAAVPVAGTVVRAALVGGGAGFFGNSVGQVVANGGVSGYSPGQAAVQGAIGAAGNVAGLGAALSMARQRSGWTGAEAAARGAGVGTTIGIGASTAANAGLPPSQGGFGGGGSGGSCTCSR